MRKTPGAARTGRRRTAMDLAVRYLARKDRTETQVLAYLDRCRVPTSEAAGIVRQLRTQRYLNDDTYARRWAAQRLARRPMGRERLEAELAAQGLSARVVSAACVEAFRDLSECEVARRALAGSRRGAAWLRRNGFSEETIDTVLGETDGARP